MTVENQTNKTAPQVMGTSFDYDFTFKVLTEDPTEAAAKEGIKVSVSNDTETVDLEYGTDYTVTLNVNGVGGTVTVTDKRTSDWSLIVYREYDLTQGSDYNNYNAFPAETLERNLDKLTMITQQLAEESSRSVKVGMFSDADPSEIVNEIEVVYANKDDVIAVAQSITDVNAVSADLTNVDIVATNISNVNTVAGDIANVNTVAGDKTNIDTVAGVSADVSTVAGIAADVSAVAAIDDDVSDVADDLTNIDAVAGDLTNINAVAGDLTNIDAVASDLTNVDAVSAALTNVGTVAGSIANVNAVGTDISNVNAVSADLTNIDTAAGNIADINTTAANIAAIIDAPNQASAAAASAASAQDWAIKTDGPVEGADYSSKYYAGQSAASANNSHIWAEGTDAQVQALGGVHSSKVWAEQSTNANIALTNSPYTTNRILEIPQDIKLELNSGTLTLKAGSKVYVPNGFEADGTTPKFDVKIIENDISTRFGAGRKECIVVVDNNNALQWGDAPAVGSGSSPFGGIYYNTSTNLIVSPAGWFNTNASLPIGVITEGSDNVESIDQIFNGFGYIGSTVFALPMKGQATTAINIDGTVTSTIWETTTVQTLTLSSSGSVSMSSTGVLTFGFNEVGYTKLADVTYYSSRIQGVDFYGVSFVANSNASNFSQAGRSYLSGLGMPSSRYIDLTLGASGTTYTAPANGYVALEMVGTQQGQNAYISSVSNFHGTYYGGYNPAPGRYGHSINYPVSSGEVFTVVYSYTELVLFRFFYAEGEN